MLKYATSEAILNFTASDPVLEVHKAVELGEGSVLACVCAHRCNVVYIYETIRIKQSIIKIQLYLNWFVSAKIWTKKRMEKYEEQY